MVRPRRVMTIFALALAEAACASGRTPAPTDAAGLPGASPPPAPAAAALPAADAGERAAASSEGAAAPETSSDPAGLPAAGAPPEAAGTSARAPAAGAPAAAPEGPGSAAVAEPAGSGASPPGGFETSVRPILQARCSPCHFEGGKMYDKLPFDSPETIRTLGERLFTRIRDENERAVIRSFLASLDSHVRGAT